MSKTAGVAVEAVAAGGVQNSIQITIKGLRSAAFSGGTFVDEVSGFVMEAIDQHGLTHADRQGESSAVLSLLSCLAPDQFLDELHDQEISPLSRRGSPR